MNSGNKWHFPRLTKLILAGALAFCLVVPSIWAAADARDMARETQIEKELGQIHPELLEQFRAARVAYDKGDYAEAARVLREFVAKAPDYDVAWRRLGAALAWEKKRAEGVEACERALALNRSAENLGTLAFALVLNTKPEENRPDYEQALKLLKESSTKTNGIQVDFLGLAAEVALNLGNQEEFRAANALLAKHFPDEMITHYDAAIQAAMEENWALAEEEAHKAEGLGLPHDAVQRLLKGHSAVSWPSLVVGALFVGGIGVGGLVLFMRKKNQVKD